MSANVDLLLITTNIKSRLHLLENMVNSITRAGDQIFTHKIMSVDVFDGEESLGYFDRFASAGWKIVFGSHVPVRGMVENQRRGLAHVQSELMVYAEDDVLVSKFPTLETLEWLNPRLGFICFNTHIHSNPNAVPAHKVNFMGDPANYLWHDPDAFLVKQPSIKDEYYLNFPVAITRTECFKKIHEIMDRECSGLGIEIAFTKGWFHLGFDRKWDTMIYLQSRVIQQKPTTAEQMHALAQMKFFNNDVGLQHPSIEGRKNSLV